MATDNGNGNGNGRNGRNGVIQIAQLASTGVLILGMFGLWWGSANPTARLDKIEINQTDNRKELNEIITNLRKEISSNYVSLREYNEQGNRITNAINEIDKKIDLNLTKAQFEAWKTERDKLVDSIQERINFIRSELIKVKDEVITRYEYQNRWTSEERTDGTFVQGIADLNIRLDKLREFSVSLSQIDTVNKRIEQLYEQMRVLQGQIFQQTHGK